MNGRGVAAADYDNDGRVDIAVNSIGGKLILLHNTGVSGHWLEVSLSPQAPGALVTAVLPDGRRLVHQVQAGSSYLSSEDPRAHFGLGNGGDGEGADRPLAGRQGHAAAGRRGRPDRHRDAVAEASGPSGSAGAARSCRA